MNTLIFSTRLVLLWCLVLLPGCVDPYAPDILAAPRSYLVVDGFINSQGVTTIALSRTFAISAGAKPPVETRATVYIEEESGKRYPLQEGTAGTYGSASLVLNAAKKHRLHLTTLAGQEYASDYVPVKTTPAIDEVSWRAENTGLSIYVNSHDDAQATRYYRWEYIETWEIIPPFAPSVEYVNGAMRPIVVPFPTICWGTANSTAVQIDKTTALSQDVVANFRVQQLPTASDRLRSRYSILVQQHALTKEEYAYWELLRKNTESIGTLFDPQPSQLTGNVHCLSNADLALGFVGAHSLAEKRIFIRRQELPTTWNVQSGYERCVPADSVSLYPPIRNPPTPAQIMQRAFTGPNYLPINPYYGMTGIVVGYLAASRDCIDCRTRGAAVKPSFWP